jgi:DNA-binding NarL/FixJ family response regulator
VKLLVVDDHPLMAEALAFALNGLETTPAVQTALDLDAAFRLLEASPADLVLLDLGLPGCAGTEALERFRERFPTLPVVVVSASSDPPLILAALDCGAMGFIPKSSGRDVILGAVRLVVSGGIFVPVQALGLRAQQPAAIGRLGGASATPEQLGLSPRQAEVLTLLLKGLPNKLIARSLDISESTAKVHVSAVLRALGVATRAQALVAASRLGLRLRH